MANIIGFGQVVVDVRCFVPRIPGIDEVVYMNRMDKQLGGMVGIAMVAAAHLGGDVELVGLVGDDDNGMYCHQELSKVNVGNSRLKNLPGSQTPFSAVLIDEESGKRTIVFNKALLLGGHKVDTPSYQGTRFLHMDGSFFESACLAAQKAKEAGITTTLDLSTNERNPDIDKLIKYADYIVVPHRFATYYTGESDFRKAGDMIYKKFSPKAVIITMGEQGSALFMDGNYQTIPAFQITALDTTGAGDSFHGGFVFALSKGYTPEQSVIFASAVAALKCSRTGGMKAFPNYLEVLELIHKNYSQTEFQSL